MRQLLDYEVWILLVVCMITFIYAARLITRSATGKMKALDLLAAFILFTMAIADMALIIFNCHAFPEEKAQTFEQFYDQAFKEACRKRD